jgi:hypothetical protein
MVEGVEPRSVLAHYGITAYRQCKVRCPVHDESRPSCSVDPVRGLINCFGCGWQGDVIKLVMEIEGLVFRDAVEFAKGLSHPGGAAVAPVADGPRGGLFGGAGDSAGGGGKVSPWDRLG